MKIALRFLLLLLTLSAGFSAPGQGRQSVLANGTWHKVEVSAGGVYKLSYEFLLQNGIITGPLPARQLKVYGYGGMVPEARNLTRPQDLPQLPVKAMAGTDGVLQPGEYLLFYAEGPHTLSFNPETGWYTHHLNIYTEKAYYYITNSAQAGQPLTEIAATGSSGPVLTAYEAVHWHEPEEVNLMESGREWFGEGLGYQKSREYSLPFTQFTGERLRMRGGYANTARSDASVTVAINTTASEQLYMREIGGGQYDLKATEASFSRIYAANAVAPGSNLVYRSQISSESTSDRTYLDYFLVQASCQLQYTNQPLRLVFPEAGQGAYQAHISTGSTNLQIWDITDPLQPHLQPSQAQGNGYTFSLARDYFPTYYAFDPAHALQPIYTGAVANQNIAAKQNVDLLIITHPEFLAEANRLAGFRQSHDGLSTLVVTTEQVYNEFSSGRPDVSALRDYATHLYNQGGLKYLLLFGRGTYDYKNITGRNLNRVPIYESYNSVYPTASYASDDYLGFLEEHEGDWAENEGGNQTLEIGIGRLPVLTETEARQVVDKLIHYSTSASTIGPWRKRIAFVADDGDQNDHVIDADLLAKQVNTLAPFYRVDKLYVDAFPQLASANGKTSPQCSEELLKTIEEGVFLLNYSGHGSRDFWTQERVLSKGMVNELSNHDRLPVIITATCDFGQHDGAIRSGGEAFLLNPAGGAIGLLTTSRPVFSYTNYQLNYAFFNYFLPTAAEGPRRLGDVIRLAKNESTPGSRVVNRNFILLGDPSLLPAYPSQQIEVTNLANLSTAGANWRAHDRVQVAGQVNAADGQPDATFDGTVEISLYDKPTTNATLGYGDNQAFTYTLQQNALFRGKASVKSGRFSLAFTLPKNIQYDTAQAKVVLYAHTTSRQRDAGGFTSALKVGGSGQLLVDKVAPGITAYLNDTTFRNGQVVGSDARLIVKLTDDNGINISSANIAQDIRAVLNDTLPIILNAYYSAQADNARQGTAEYQLSGLAPGRHSLYVEAWDLNDNQAQTTITFTVSNKNSLEITALNVVPNPARESFMPILTHTRAGETLAAEVGIYSNMGKLVYQAAYTIEGSQNLVNLAEIAPAANKLKSGLYILRVRLRSLSDGSFAEKTQKFIILQ